MRVLIQRHNREFTNINLLTAYLGFKEKGYLINFFEQDELDSYELDNETIVVAGIPVVSKAFIQLGIAHPRLESIPESISKYAKRRTWKGTIKEARQAVYNGGALFVKPIPDNHKFFNGKLLDSYRVLASLASLPDDFPVICSEPVSMISEYRVFVLKGEAIGCRHYKGDFKVFPDFTLIDSAINDFKKAPSGYSIDFAITETGNTILIEINDGLYLGCYGLSPIRYSSLIEARWMDLLPGN